MLTSCELFMTDSDTKFSKSIGWIRGERTGRYAIIIDHGKITYAENEPGGDVTVNPSNTSFGTMSIADERAIKVSGANAVLDAL